MCHIFSNFCIKVARSGATIIDLNLIVLGYFSGFHYFSVYFCFNMVVNRRLAPQVALFASNCNQSVAEAIQSCSGVYTAMLRRLYSHLAKTIQQYSGGYRASLQRLYVFFLPIIVPPQQQKIGLLVGLWQFISLTRQSR